MNEVAEDQANEKRFQKWAIEAALRIAILAGLIVWCFKIMQPFIGVIVWGAVIAAALNPLFLSFRNRLGGRNKLAATLFTLIAVVLLLWPAINLSLSSVGSVEHLVSQVESGQLDVPQPPVTVKDWPVVGESLYKAWHQASENLAATVEAYRPQLKQLASWLLGVAAGAGVGILSLLVSIVIAGVFMANGPAMVASAERVLVTLAGDQGAEYAALAGATVRSVAQGVLGVAVIQSLAAGVGMLWIGVPGAGILAVLVLGLAIVQLPPLLVLLPVSAYVFTANEFLPAVIFFIWALVVSVSDSFLKPMLMGRGMSVPTLVIFIGALGGFMLSGFVGLFTGAVVFVLGYTLMMAWLGGDGLPELEDSPPS